VPWDGLAEEGLTVMVGWCAGGGRRAAAWFGMPAVVALGVAILLAPALAVPAVAASARVAGAGQAGAAVAGSAQPGYGPAGIGSLAGKGVATSTNSDAFTSNSCTWLSQDLDYLCLATGRYSTGGTVQPLALDEGRSHIWQNEGPVPDAPNGNLVNLPAAVSCQSYGGTASCAMVGSHYATARTAAQFAETWNYGTLWNVWASGNPSGTTWSGLADVFCESLAHCMAVGAAGTSKTTPKGVVFTGHATAYNWDGGLTFTPLRVPAPAGAKASDLAGVGCWSNTACLAVGNYTNAKGKWLPYSVLWNNGTWQLKPVPQVPGQASTTFKGIYCPELNLCVAAGYSAGPGSHPFAARWSNGKWAVMKTPAENTAGFSSVACLSGTTCYAVGWLGNAALIEAWNGSAWAAQPAPATPAPFSGNVLTHVSCAYFDVVTASVCQAVGYRFNPAIPASQRTYQTLADVRDPTTTGWQLQDSPNP
jgi:hypothetical protein